MNVDAAMSPVEGVSFRSVLPRLTQADYHMVRVGRGNFQMGILKTGK